MSGQSLNDICAACGSPRREHMPGGTRYGPTTLCGVFIPQQATERDDWQTAVHAAMFDAWNEICSDTGCHPLDIERRGRKLYFTPHHWADAVARHLFANYVKATLSPTPPPPEAVTEETLAEEFERLIREFRSSVVTTEKNEAWNLIADFAEANSSAILAALKSRQDKQTPVTTS